MDAPSPLISIIVPVYNEERTVADVIARLLSIDLPAPREIIVVNDGSRDGTAAVLAGLEGTPRLTVINADRNRGKGHAIRLGFSHARGTVFAIQDADLELDPAQIADLVAPILRGEADVVYGSRFLTGTSPTPWLSRVANGALTSFTNLLHGSSLTDMETCYKVMRREVARSLDLQADRFDIEPEITSKLLLGGHDIVERPVSFTPRSRAAGKKIGWRDGVVAVRVLYGLRPRGALLTRALLLAAFVAVCVALTVIVGDGFELRAGRLLVRAHSPWVPSAVAIAAIGLALARGRTQVASASRWWWLALGRVAGPLAGLVVAVTMIVGWLAGTHAAGGSDSNCYLSQAEMFARGDAREAIPLADGAPWPNARLSFTPSGFATALDGSPTVVPICAGGYPLMMAGARLVGGRPAMFWIVPLLGGLAVWLTYRLGRALGGPHAGLLAAVLLGASPVFLYQVVQPMSDVPAAALWTAALAAALTASTRGSGARWVFVAGLVSGAALMVRPNLLPLAVVLGVGIAWLRATEAGTGGRFAGLASRSTIVSLLAYGLGALPGVAAILALQNAIYGNPVTSGYGPISTLFAFDHVAPNARLYTEWLLQTETPVVIAALAAPLVTSGARSRAAWWLIVFAAATLACYLGYAVFDAWWYLRFLLPALPAVLVLTSATLGAGIARLPYAWRAPTFALVCCLLAVVLVHKADEGRAFELRTLEARFRDAGEYVARRLPPDAAIVTVHQSGSVRFYSGRPTMLWGFVEPDLLDRSLDYLRARGLHPYVLLEAWEEPAFRERFRGHTILAGLEWPPVAEINRDVRIYDPADCAPYLKGGHVATDRVWTRGPRP